MGFVLGLLTGLLVCAVIAITAYRRIDRLQRRARQTERLAELGTLTSGLAHEIKNPLSTVQLNLQLLKEDLPADHPDFPRLVNRLDTVRRETTRLREILDDFMRYAGKIELDRKPTDVGVVLEELVDFFAPQAQQNKVQLRHRKPDDGPIVASVDEKLLKQAILNLMINAVQAMAERGGELILSANRTPDGGLRVDVIDTGPGIAPDAVSKIFDAYYSTKRGGTGLGLAITRRIVDEHGGRITVSSEVGKGSDFAVLLPPGGRRTARMEEGG